MTTTPQPRASRIQWQNVSTVLSAAVLIGAEVFGAAFAGGWAIANLFQLGDYGVYTAQIVLFVIGVVIMINFVRAGMKVEPFTTRE
jgi:membrane protein implicated in regulation of membrane protease activity